MRGTMRQVLTALGLAACVAATSAPNLAVAQYDNDTGRHHHYHHYHHQYDREGCARRNHKAGVIGAVGGGLGGAAIGGAITHGNPASMLLGAGAGALAGNAIGRNSHHC